ncbi:unnamed protein product [Ambrosiozyma monospora]|uniref:Unnamed protein product n=1 Tax=Ambrosiozyma monospora TaxID=43982 RepID=A0ACB5U1H0_AMBMO|nr:unnamed protein product [Ambrosiozyma monospora]
MSTPIVKFGPLKNTKLFKEIEIAGHKLDNRLVFCPTSRKRAAPGFFPSNLQHKYYKDRSTKGSLVIVESTFANIEAGVNNFFPSIYTDKHAEGYKVIADSIHANGGIAALQLHQLGRVANPAKNKELNLPFLGVSTKYLSDASKKAAIDSGNELRMMTTEEVKLQQDKYVAACKRAIQISGFDFVEIHY